VKPFRALRMRTAAAAIPDGETFTATVTIASGTVASNLTDFPVLINLHDMPAGFWSAVKSDGGDIRAYDSTDTLIPHDLCRINTGSTSGILMVKKTVATASSTVIKIRCGNAALSALSVSDTNGRNAVWSDYDLVVGFGGSTTDRTGATRTLAGTSGTASTNVDFLGFNGSQEKTWVTLTGRTVYTMGCSYYLTAAVTQHNGLVAYQAASNPNALRENLLVRNVSPAAIALWNPTDSWLQPTSTGGTASTLYRAHGLYNSTTDRKLYLNGALIGTDTGATVSAGSADMLRLGGTAGAGESATAEIGYAYLRPSLLSANWLAAEYLNWHTPASFYTVT
jgi:hypothetical protein